MPKYLVTMVCKEIWRAEVILHGESDFEHIKDAAWRMFDKHRKKDLEQENYTKVRQLV